MVVLFMRQNRFIQAEKEQKAMVAEMEELLSGYLLEMKEENEALLGKLMNQPQSVMNQGTSKEAAIQQEIPRFEEGNRPSVSYSPKNKAAEAYKSQTGIKQRMKQEGISKVDANIEESIGLEQQSGKPEKASFMETLHASLNGQSVQEPSLHEQVNALAKQGLAAEEIAQHLKRGKTEIELLLKFQNGI